MSIKKVIAKFPFLISILNYRYLIIFLREKYFSGRKSYAQFQDDLKATELLGQIGSFIDIGANDGYCESNTFLFGKKGAKGICFEPTPSIFKKLKLLYAFNSNVTCLNVGVSDENKELEIVSAGVLSYIEDTKDENHKKALSSFFSQNEKKEKIVLKKFEDALQGLNFPKAVDLLSVDVEGHELNVLKSIPFDKYSFKLIILETHAKDANGKITWMHRDIDQINQLLTVNNYNKVFENRGNSFYIKK